MRHSSMLYLRCCGSNVRRVLQRRSKKIEKKKHTLQQMAFLKIINEASADALQAKLLEICGSPLWARQVVDSRPFASEQVRGRGRRISSFVARGAVTVRCAKFGMAGKIW